MTFVMILLMVVLGLSLGLYVLLFGIVLWLQDMECECERCREVVEAFEAFEQDVKNDPYDWWEGE